MSSIALDRGVYLTDKKGWYRIRFVDKNRKPKERSISLQTNHKPTAVEKALALLRDYRLGVFDPWKSKGESITLKDALQVYAKKRKHELRPHTIVDNVNVAQGLLDTLPPTVLLEHIDPDDIRTFIYRPGLAPTTQLSQYRKLGSFFGWFTKRGYLRENPMEKVDRPKKVKNIPKYLTVDQLDDLLEAIEADYQAKLKYMKNVPDPRWIKDVIEFAACTGLRLNEIRHLRWRDVHLPTRSTHGYIEIQSFEGYRTKHDSNGIVELIIPRAISVLEYRFARRVTEDEKEWVFLTSQDRQVPYGWTSKRFRHYREIAGLPEYINFHSLRHTFAVICRMAGVDLLDLKDLMRHKTIDMTLNYSRFNPGLISKKYEGRFDESGRPKRGITVKDLIPGKTG